MSIRSFGSEQSTTTQTPTLKQFLKANGGKCPTQSNVKVIFPPNQFGGYTFITDHNFRVQQANDPELNSLFAELLEESITSEETLVVQVKLGDKPTWSLGVDTDQGSKWETFPWGFKAELLPRKKNQTGKKTSTPKNDSSPSELDPVA